MTKERTIVQGDRSQEAIADLIITGNPEPTREQIKPAASQPANVKILPLLIGTIALMAIVTADASAEVRRRRFGGRQNRVRVVRAQTSYRPVAYRPPAVSYNQTRGNNGTLTEDNIYQFRQQFADGQSRQAMRSALGEPAETRMWGSEEIYKIQRIGIDGKPTGKYGEFRVKYGGDGRAFAPIASW